MLRAQFSVKSYCQSLLLGAVVVGLWYWNRRERNSIVAFAGLWLIVGLAPALYLRNFGNGDFVRDRYMYLPSIGFCDSGGHGTAAIAIHTTMDCAGGASICCTGIVLRLCVRLDRAASILGQTICWCLCADNRSIREIPCSMAGLAKEYSQRGAHDQAIALAQSVVKDHPEYGYGPLALAESYIRAGRFEEGRVWLNRVNPDYAKSEVGMAGVAGLYGEIGDYDHALALCSEILGIEPDLFPRSTTAATFT